MTASSVAFLGFGGSSQTLVELLLLSAILAYSAFAVMAGGSYSFAFVAFVSLGAYTGGYLMVDKGTTIWVALVVAPVLAGLAAAVVSRPLERVSGIYLALMSVALIMVFQVVVLNLPDLTGGATGKLGVPLEVDVLLLVAVTAVLALGFALVQRSMLGRAMRLLRADELVAASMGIHVRRLQLWLFITSAAIAAIGGALRASYLGFVTPREFGFDLLITILATVILGGLSHWSGPIVGAALWTLLPEWLRPLGEWREVAMGVILLVIIIVLPQGVTGGIADVRRRIRARRASRREVGGPAVEADHQPGAQVPPPRRVLTSGEPS